MPRLHSSTPLVRLSTVLLLFLLVTGCGEKRGSSQPGRAEMADVIEASLRTELLEPWYPRSIDREAGGHYSNLGHDFAVLAKQEKMLVSQARHLWTQSRAHERYPEVPHYREGAEQGLRFLVDRMWDAEHGGFRQWVTRAGDPVDGERRHVKTAYGNAFAIYALAAMRRSTGDPEALAMAISTFQWLDEQAHDPFHGGYYQDLARTGVPLPRPPDAGDDVSIGYKDQNSSIHLLEAFTELYHVWPEPRLRERLEEMLVLIRDTMITEAGYLVLFFEPDWTPISFRDRPREEIAALHYFDHVSFGHDVETAFLLLEAAEALGIPDDPRTHAVAKKLVDHALSWGWDEEQGGFYYEGYTFAGEEAGTITVRTKDWWVQAEALNTFLLMADLYPDDPQDFYGKFVETWEYIDTHLIDHEHGGWYPGGLDQQPEMQTAPKGSVWKTTYHNYRALARVVDRLQGKDGD